MRFSRTIASGSTLKAHLKKKIDRIININKGSLGRMSYRWEQVFVDAVYRYYVTPYVLTGLIKYEEAKEVK